jgi:peptidoglycan/LPS O-acetylase OafA/YrhL
LLGHLHDCFLSSYWKSGSRNLVIAAPVLMSSFHHETVMIFFVLSGYLIGTSVLKGAVNQHWSWSNYIIRRATRLYVVLLPALLLTGVFDHLGLRLFGASGNIYAARRPGYTWAFTNPDTSRLGAKVFLGNALYLQGLLVPCYGSNMALWSLSFEWWYYILFPVILLTGKWTYTIATVLTAVAVYLSDFTIVGYFGIWLMGAALNTQMFASARCVTVRRALTMFVINLILIRIFKIVLYHDVVPRIAQGCIDYEVGIASLVLINTILRDTRDSRGGAYRRLARRLAGMSYTLYAVHSPIVVFFTAMLVGSGELWKPGLLTFGKVGAVASFSIMVAYLLARLFEDRTDIIRKSITSLLASSRVASNVCRN